MEAEGRSEDVEDGIIEKNFEVKAMVVVAGNMLVNALVLVMKVVMAVVVVVEVEQVEVEVRRKWRLMLVSHLRTYHRAPLD